MSKVLCFLSFMFLLSCHLKINQYAEVSKNIRKRNGFWVEKYQDREFISKGRYSLGEKIGVWRTFYNGHLAQREKIKDGIIRTKFYYPNGKIWQKGQSRMDVSQNERHWYYFGDWCFYDENGRLQNIKKYVFGKKTDSISVR